MPFFVDDDRHWSERAVEARHLADGLTDPVAKRTMMDIAAAYERMAERAVQRERRRAPPDEN